MPLSGDCQIRVRALNQWTKSLLGRMIRIINCHHLERTFLFSPCVITTAGQSKEFPLVAQYQNLQLHSDGSN